jgi:hypothetical protein
MTTTKRPELSAEGRFLRISLLHREPELISGVAQTIVVDHV